MKTVVRRVALREDADPGGAGLAEALSLNARVEAVSAALRQRFGDYGPNCNYDDIPHCQDTFDSSVVFRRRGKLWRLDYTVSDAGAVSLSEEAPQEVAADVEYVPVSEAAVLESLSVQEGDQPAGLIWSVTLISAGDSANGRTYPADVLKKAAPLFEGVKAYADHPGRTERRDRPERSVRDVVGWFEGARYDAKKKAITAKLHLSEAAGALRQLVLDAWNRGKKDLIGLSINAEGQIQESIDGGKRRRTVTEISRVSSVDLVTEPAAGGRLEQLVASVRPDTNESESHAMDSEEIKRIIGAALAEALGPIQAEIVAVRTLAEQRPAAVTPAGGEPITEAVPSAASASPAAASTAGGADDAAVRRLVEAGLTAERERLTALERGLFDSSLTASLNESRLPAQAQARVRRLFDGRVGTTEEVTASIREERDYLAALRPSSMTQFGRVHQGEGASIGEDEGDKYLKQLYGMFDNADVDKVPRFGGLKEAFFHLQRIQGQDDAGFFAINPTSIFEAMKPRLKGEKDRSRSLYEARVRDGLSLEEAIHVRLRESLVTSDWGQVFADVLYNRLVKAYNTDALYNEWRLIVSDQLNVPDFRTQHLTRVGGFANLSSVAEQGTYPNLTSPTDEEVTFAITKYGGLHDITMESVVNDNIAAIRRIPMAMARAAKRTLRNDVLNQATTTNPTLAYDSVALYAAGHGNTGTTALTVSGLAAVERAMRDQTAYNESAFLLGAMNKPRRLIIPNELEQIADRIVNGVTLSYVTSPTADTDASIDPNYFKDKGIIPIVYDELTDANDWFSVADPSMVPTIALGFLNGNDQPELLVQDNPTVGSTFTADKITTKVRLIWGRAVIDHRSFYRQVVA